MGTSYASNVHIVLTVSSSKYTGAAAVAELWCRSLRAIGFEANLLCVRGDNLERRLESKPWAQALLLKERRPSHIRHNLTVFRRYSRESDVMITLLPHDHFEAVFAGAHHRTPIVRAFRRPRHLRPDPLHRWFAHRASAAIAPCSELVETTGRYMGGKPVGLFDVPVEDRFTPATDSDETRHTLFEDTRRPVVGMVGKLAADRGFDCFIDAASLMATHCNLLIVGHGELQSQLESQARTLGISDRIHWAGKREDDLPRLLRTMDILVFTAPGSDWGHRVITEAQACGRAVVAVNHRGVTDLVDHNRTGLVVESDPTTIAEALEHLLRDKEKTLRLSEAAASESTRRRFVPIGRAMAKFLEEVVPSPCS